MIKNDENIIHEKKIKVNDYIFCYENYNLKNVHIKYWCDKIKSITYENGIKISEKYTPMIDISIEALDENNRFCAFDAMLNTNIDNLNELSSESVNMVDYIVKGETLFTHYNKMNKIKIENIDFTNNCKKYPCKPTIFLSKNKTKYF